MNAALEYIEEWIPERMSPGTIFVLEAQSNIGPNQNPYVAVMSCPQMWNHGPHNAPPARGF